MILSLLLFQWTYHLHKLVGVVLRALKNAIMLSDYYDNSFGKDYGVLIEEWHLLARAVLVADADNKITYVEYLDNINTDPNYEAAVAAVKSL